MVATKNRTIWRRWVLSALLLAVVGAGSAYFLLNPALLVLQVTHNSPPFRETSKGTVENTYVLKIQNKDTRDHELKLKISGFPSAVLKTSKPQFQMRSGEVVEISVSIEAKVKDLPQARIAFDFVIFDSQDPGFRTYKEGRFVAPGDVP